MNSKNKIAWIGLGQMGLPMSTNLVKSGWSVTGYDIAPARVELAATAGVRSAASIATAVVDADIVFTMLFDGKVLKEALSGPEGILAHVKPGALLVDMSTIAPEASAEIAGLIEDKGCRYLRAPVSGSQTIAEAGALSIFVSGNQRDFENLRPVFDGMSSSQDYVGPGEAARVIKLVINMLVGSATAALGEAFRFGRAWNISRDVLVDAVNSSIVGSRHYLSRAPGLKSGKYTNAGPLAMLLKDIGMVMSDAQNKGYQLPIHHFTYDIMAQMVEEGRGALEATVLVEYQPDAHSPGIKRVEDERELIAADDARYAAMLSGDGKRLDALLSPGLTYIHTKGICQDKAGFLESFNSGQFVYQRIDREAGAVTVSGDCAFMEGVVRIAVAVSGEPRTIHNRYLAGWERGADGNWRLRSWMGVPVPADGKGIL